MRSFLTTVSVLWLATLLVACQPADDGDTAVETEKNVDEFVGDLNEQLETLNEEIAAALWVRSTYITPDTGVLASKALERGLEFQSEAVEESKAYEGKPMSEDSTRAIHLLKLGTPMPAPNDSAKRAELAEIATDLEGMYGAGKYCPDGEESCKTLPELEQVLANSRDYDEQLDTWIGWRTVAPPMRDKYTRFAELANEGASELGFENLGAMWKSGYDMPADAFEAETERLWGQVKPLYNELHCYVRDRLVDHYGEDKVSPTGPIPAHLLGNMWSQTWSEILDLTLPYPDATELDVDSALKSKHEALIGKYISEGRDDARQVADHEMAVEMVEMAENFYTSLGFPELPESFWERAMLTKPRDREVVCHASAWPMGGDDVRIKQCIEPTREQLWTIFHELGHVYYFLLYTDQPPLFQTGAHDGFHEAIGDTVNLSMTPVYMQQVGLVDNVEQSQEALINEQMQLALDKIAFLPFGKLIDLWRWDVFAGKITPDNYNEAWWALRTKYQGIEPPVERTEADFDPGAKYHIPGNTPYTRYFLSAILQFQFQRALCEAAGHEGPLHECSVYGSKDAGDRFGAMLVMGGSRPWPDALEELTGTREMDASAIIEYFDPLMSWLKEQNEGKACGWEETAVAEIE